MVDSGRISSTAVYINRKEGQTFQRTVVESGRKGTSKSRRAELTTPWKQVAE